MGHGNFLNWTGRHYCFLKSTHEIAPSRSRASNRAPGRQPSPVLLSRFLHFYHFRHNYKFPQTILHAPAARWPSEHYEKAKEVRNGLDSDGLGHGF